MLEPKLIGKFKGLKKNLSTLLCLPLLGILLVSLSCNSTGTSSTSSGSITSGTGTGWTIEIKIGTNPLPFNGTDTTNGSNTTTVLALVRDKTGAPAPKGTNICTTAVLNGFLKAGSTDVFATICGTTENDLGQSIQTYQGKYSGIDTIEVSSQGVIARATLTVK
jgi:hypothetical protein